MSVRAKPPFRADHVGSFLRPAQLLAARERCQRGEIGKAALRAVEDAAIADIVRMQEEVGLHGITDGEKLVEAMKGMAWTSPRGPMSIDPATRDVVQNVYIRKCERVDGKLYNVEFDKIENFKDPGV